MSGVVVVVRGEGGGEGEIHSLGTFLTQNALFVYDPLLYTWLEKKRKKNGKKN